MRSTIAILALVASIMAAPVRPSMDMVASNPTEIHRRVVGRMATTVNRRIPPAVDIEVHNPVDIVTRRGVPKVETKVGNPTDVVTRDMSTLAMVAENPEDMIR